MAKKVQAYVKLQVAAGMANPSPPVGPALGQQGVNIMEFCKAFNAKTDSIEKGLPIPVVITVYADRSFTFVTKTPPAAVLLKKAAGIKSGSGKPNKDKVGKISRAQLQEIAQTKAADMTGADIEAMTRSIEGTARSMVGDRFTLGGYDGVVTRTAKRRVTEVRLTPAEKPDTKKDEEEKGHFGRMTSK